MTVLETYGLQFNRRVSQLEIEMAVIREGGVWNGPNGQRLGRGLFHHYRAMFDLCWPDHYHHRWSDLGLRRICERDITVHMGPGDTGKTYLMAKFVLCHWWVFGNKALWLVSSTEARGSDLRIWGKLIELFNAARSIHSWLGGYVLNSQYAFTTEKISDDGFEGRALTSGIIWVPVKQGSIWTSMGGMQGVKPPPGGWLGHCGDECQAMPPSFLSAYANWYGKERFKGMMAGNPTGVDDPLCRAAHPPEGWTNWKDTGKTQEWQSDWYDAWVIAYDGRDTPNNDPPTGRFPALIGPKKINAVKRAEGPDSDLFWNQCVGKPRPGAAGLRVISLELCRLGRAYDVVVWDGSPTTKLAACDAAYGGVGGDRCVLMTGEFGRENNGGIVLKVSAPVLVPVSVDKPGLPEDQIAKFCRAHCEAGGIRPENFFFDGRSTLALAFGRLWSENVNAVDFGGPATARPVSEDEYVWEGDTQTRRLKRCDEHYSKFVTELWFSVRYCILGQQLRELSKSVAEEGCKRAYIFTKGNRIEVETKAEMKLRTRQSPDEFDTLVTLVEGARRLGFSIQNVRERPVESAPDDWLERERDSYRKRMKGRELNYAA